MPVQHLFSTGRLRVGAPGLTALTAADDIGEVQGISFDGTYEKKDMRTAASITNFAVDVAHYDGKAMLKIETGDFQRWLLPYILGAVKTTAGGVDTYTVGGTSKPAYCRVEFKGYDTEGKYVEIIFPRAKISGLALAFKRDDYAMPSFEAEAYLIDPTNPALGCYIIKAEV